MEFFRFRRDIPFMRYALVFNIISLATFLLAVYFLATRGLALSVELTGGTVMELSYRQTADISAIRTTLQKSGYKDLVVQSFGSSHDVLVRVPSGGEQAALLSNKIMENLRAVDADVQLRRVEFVGPQVSRDLLANSLTALILVVVGIVVYLAVRFEWRFAVSAIIANLHDVIIILGFFSFFRWEFSLSVLAAVLAVLGYSVNESVVVMDRVRENFRKMRTASVPEVINNAITATMSRTIITHGSTEMAVLSMLLFGGETLHYFAVALTIGILFGIYSSVLVASPLLMWLGVSRDHFIKKPKKVRSDDPSGGAVV